MSLVSRHVLRMAEMRNVYKFWPESQMERNYLEDLRHILQSY
jgi:hypothetical protein